MMDVRLEMPTRCLMSLALMALAVLSLTACGGSGGGYGGGTPTPTPTTYTIGGTISGLTASGLKLANGSDTASPASGATSFSFPTAVASGTAYSVSFSAQPSGQTCTMTNGSGTVGSANVSNVQVTCAANNMSGTAATGSAIANATVTLVDSKGAQVTATTSSSGQYSLSTNGMTAPFLVKVVTASASTNGYASGTTFYSVSNQSTPSVINVTPLTDLIVRNWYAAQSVPVSIATAFSNPGSNPPPSVAQVQLIQAVVLDIVQPVLQQNGVNPIGLDLISGNFSANGQGVDAALDQIKPITYNTAGTTATLTVNTTSTVTQTTTITASAGTTQVSTSTSNASGTVSSMVTSSVVPTSSAEAAALAGAQTTLTNIGNTIQSKGSSLAASDILPYLDSNFLDRGTTASQQASGIATQMAGATINSFTVTRVTTFDATNNLIGIVGTINYTKGGVTGSIKFGYGSDLGIIFKLESSGSWLMYGDQQQAKTNLAIESVNDQGLNSYMLKGNVLDLQLSVPTATTSTPCSSSYATSVKVYPAAAISGTSQNTSTAVTIGTSGYPLIEDTTVYQQKGVNVCQFNALSGNALFVLSPSSLAGLVGDSVGFALNGGSPVAALARTIPGYTTETIGFTNLTSHALSAASLGQPLTLNWTLPVTFPVYNVEAYGEVYSASGSGYVACEVNPSAPVAITATSATLTLPTTCNGTAVATIPQPGPAGAQVTVIVQGSHGEIASAWWAFN